MKSLRQKFAIKRLALITSLVLTISACDHDVDDTTPPIEPPANTAPTISSSATITIEEGAAYSYSLVAADADGDTLTLSATTLPTWLTFDAASGALTGTPTTSDVGDHAITLSVSDGTDATTQSFTITVTAIVVANTPPVITSTGTTSATVGTNYSYQLTATDADGDTLSMSSVTLPSWGTFDSATGILSGTPDMAGDYPIELMVSDGNDAINQAFTIAVTEASAVTVELVVFENAALLEWAAWINDGGSTEVVTDDVDHDQAVKFVLTAPSVAGFTARDGDGAVNGATFDASGLTNGMISFELKMLKAPTAGVVDWKLKVEAGGGSTNAEVNISTAVEGHSTPVLDTWQTYTFPISALGGNLDTSAIDLFMVFPNYNDAPGAEFLLDNLMIINDTNGGNNGGGGGEPSGDAPITFEADEVGAGYTWTVFENDDNPALEIVANPDATGANTSAMVAKFTARQTGMPWAGTESAHGDFGPFTFDSSNSTVKIMVYKSVISDVGIKFAIASGGAQGEIKVANTLVNQWEELTFDFSGNIGMAESINIDQIIIFADFNLDGRSADTVSYFDNITFSN